MKRVTCCSNVTGLPPPSTLTYTRPITTTKATTRVMPKLAQRQPSVPKTKPTITTQVVSNREKETERIDLPVPPGARPAWIVLTQLPRDLQMTPQLFDTLWDLHPEELGQVVLYGKLRNTPRYQASYGEDYYYTGMIHKAHPIPHPYIEALLQWVRQSSGENYRQVLINWYRSGDDYIGPHSDSMKDLVPESAIYSISLGATRDFFVKSMIDNSKYKLTLEENDVVIMCGSMQRYYKHEVPKRKGAGKRINVTFRLKV